MVNEIKVNKKDMTTQDIAGSEGDWRRTTGCHMKKEMHRDLQKATKVRANNENIGESKATKSSTGENVGE